MKLNPCTTFQPTLGEVRTMQVRKGQQLNPVSDEVLALTAVVRPILSGVLNGIKADVLKEAGGLEQVKLMMLPRLYRPGDGDVGICFEYAVHEALSQNDSRVTERVNDALKLCNIKSADPASLLVGFEKSGAVQLIDTAKQKLTNDSRVMSGGVGQPPKLLPRLNTIAAAFRRATTRLALPQSIRGIWKADLFLGSLDSQQWVGTSVKINPSQLEAAAGLRVGIVPTRSGRDDRVRVEASKRMVICPLHHDADFMQTFYEGWRIVQAFLAADAKAPKEVVLPRPVDREICRMLEERRQFPVVDIVDALKIFSQPELLQIDQEQVGLENIKGEGETQMVLAPISRLQ